MSYKKPNFFIIGAPKCGTTSLAYWLSSHPNIFMSSYKEPHYYNKGYNSKYFETYEKYLELFEDASDKHQIIGEASTGYLYSKIAVKNILKDTNREKVKFLVMLREPAKMAYSLHGHNVFWLEEPIKDFKKAWECQDKRKSNYKKTLYTRDIEFLKYNSICKLGSQLNDLYKIVSRDQVKVVLLEDLKKDALSTYKDIICFLDLNYKGKTNFEVYNNAKKSKYNSIKAFILFFTKFKNKLGIRKGLGLGIFSFFEKINTEKITRKQINSEFEKELKEYFKEDVQLLENLIDRDLSHWY